MINKAPLRAALAVLTLTVTVAGCNRGGAGDSEFASEEGLLRYVPADTPYVFATGEPMPDDVLDKIEPRVAEILDAYRAVLRDVVRGAMAENESGMDPEEIERVSTVADELFGLLSVDGMRAAGIDRDSQFVLFGNGLLPVLRIEISDEAGFEAAIARIEEASDTSMETAEIDGVRYRYVGNGEARLAIAVVDGSAVVTVIPALFDEVQAKQLLGITLPAQNIAETGRLAEIASGYDFTDHLIGLIDTQRLAAIFLEAPGALDAALLNAAEYDLGSISPVCRAEIRSMVDVAPRIVTGYNAIDTDAMVGSAIVELREDIAAGLTKVAAPVPGLGSDPGGLVSFGMSFNLLALREFYEARLDAIEADPYECEYFAPLQAGVAQGRAVLQQPIPPVVYGLRGFQAVVDDLGDFDLASGRPPSEIDASVVIAMEDAQTMIAAGAMFSPQIASLELAPDGKPKRLDLPQLAGISDSVFAAMLDDALAVSVGSGAEARVAAVLMADIAEPSPAFSMTMDAGRYYALIGDAMMMQPDAADDAAQMSPEARETLRDAMVAVAGLYQRFVIDMYFTERGLVIRERLEFQD